MIGAFLEGFDDETIGLFAGEIFVVTGEDADVGGSEEGCAIDPCFAFGDFLVAFWTFLEREVVADCGAADGDAFEEGVFSDVGEVGVVDVFWEEVGGEFGSGAVMGGAIIEKAEHVELGVSGGFIGTVREWTAEVVADGVGCEAEEKSRWPFARHGGDCTGVRGDDCSGGGCE